MLRARWDGRWEILPFAAEYLLSLMSLRGQKALAAPRPPRRLDPFSFSVFYFLNLIGGGLHAVLPPRVEAAASALAIGSLCPPTARSFRRRVAATPRLRRG